MDTVVEIFRDGCGLANVCINRDMQMYLSPLVPFHYTGK